MISRLRIWINEQRKIDCRHCNLRIKRERILLDKIQERDRIIKALNDIIDSEE